MDPLTSLVQSTTAAQFSQTQTTSPAAAPLPAAMTVLTSSQEPPATVSSTVMPLTTDILPSLRQTETSYRAMLEQLLPALKQRPNVLAQTIAALLAMPGIRESTDANVKRLVALIGDLQGFCTYEPGSLQPCPFGNKTYYTDSPLARLWGMYAFAEAPDTEAILEILSWFHSFDRPQVCTLQAKSDEKNSVTIRLLPLTAILLIDIPQALVINETIYRQIYQIAHGNAHVSTDATLCIDGKLSQKSLAISSLWSCDVRTGGLPSMTFSSNVSVADLNEKLFAAQSRFTHCRHTLQNDCIAFQDELTRLSDRLQHQPRIGEWPSPFKNQPQQLLYEYLRHLSVSDYYTDSGLNYAVTATSRKKQTMNLTVLLRFLHFLITLKKKRPDLNFGVNDAFSVLSSMAEKLPLGQDAVWRHTICLWSANGKEKIDTQKTFNRFQQIAQEWLSSTSEEDLWTAWFGQIDVRFSPSKNAFEQQALSLDPSQPLTSLFAFPPCGGTKLAPPKPLQTPPLTTQPPPQDSDVSAAPPDQPRDMMTKKRRILGSPLTDPDNKRPCPGEKSQKTIKR